MWKSIGTIPSFGTAEVAFHQKGTGEFLGVERIWIDEHGKLWLYVADLSRWWDTALNHLAGPAEDHEIRAHAWRDWEPPLVVA